MAINSYSTIHIVSDAPFWLFGEQDNDYSGVNLGTCTTFGCSYEHERDGSSVFMGVACLYMLPVNEPETTDSGDTSTQE